MGVGRTLQSEFVRVHTHLFLDPEPPEKRGTNVVSGVGGRGVSTRVDDVSIALVPQLEVCELVLRRKERMGLGCALDLQHLNQRLPPHAGPRILGADGTTFAVHHLEHPSAGEVRVVGDGDEVDPEPITGRL